MPPKVLVITGYGINCEEETLHSFTSQGAIGEIVHINDLIDGTKRLDDYEIMAFPGGFSYGDDTGSGNAFANRIKNNIEDQIFSFAQKDKLIIGICNGFQILVNLGLVPATKNQYGKRECALMWNSTARLECRWTTLKNQSKKCVWTRGVDIIPVPIAHGEGNFYATPEILEILKTNDQIAFRYVTENGEKANGIYPINPNGALDDIAGITDESGRILGMMPHPERFNSIFNHPDWPRMKQEALRQGKTFETEGLGNKIFKNAVEYFKI